MPNWSIVSLSLLLGVVVRWGVSLNSYSGRLCVERVSAAGESQQWLQVRLLSRWRFQLFNEFRYNSRKALGLVRVCACVWACARETNWFLNVCLSRSWQTAHVWWLWSPETLARGHLQQPCWGMVRTDALAWKVLVFYLCPWTKHKVLASVWGFEYVGETGLVKKLQWG